jgi:hypothetical protein
MQYPYLFLLESVILFLTLCLAMIIFYLLAKINQEIRFITALKAFISYQLVAVLIYWAFPFQSLGNFFVLITVNLLIFGTILFFVFYLITEKLLSFNWGKSLILFLLLTIIIFPFLSFVKTEVTTLIIDFPLFEREIEKMSGEINLSFIHDLSGTPSFLFLGTIEQATLSWSVDVIRKLIFAR